MFISAVVLAGIGLTILHALSPDLFYHQIWSVLLGIVAFVFLRRTDPKIYQNLWWMWYVIVLVGLTVTLFMPEVRGAHSWVEIYGVSLQPSEIMKPLLIISLAGFISTRKKYGFGQFIAYTILFAIPLFLIMKQPDLGSSIVYMFAYLAILFVSAFPLKYYILPILGLLVVAPASWPFLQEYQKMRIISFINPEYDVQGAGYNAYQALIAVGSGGLFGKGLGQGTQTGLFFLPEFHTDFIFAATVEQIGMVGGLVILGVYGWLMISILHALREGNMFNRLIVWGFFAQLLIQILVNVGMNTGIVPITGITLPLLSFGGSSILATFISLGIISSFTRDKNEVIAIR